MFACIQGYGSYQAGAYFNLRLSQNSLWNLLYLIIAVAVLTW